MLDIFFKIQVLNFVKSQRDLRTKRVTKQVYLQTLAYWKVSN